MINEIKFLEKYKDYSTFENFGNLSSLFMGITNVSVSFTKDNQKIYTFTGMRDQRDIPKTYFMDTDKQIIDLHAHTGMIAGAARLVRLDKNYITFNSDGTVYAVEINETTHRPKTTPIKLTYYKSAQYNEKNWALYDHDGNIYCVYSLSPLVILKAVSRDRSCWVFDEHYKESDKKMNQELHLGTPMIRHSKTGKYYSMSHRITKQNNKNVYTGSIVELDHESNQIKISSDTWYESLYMLLSIERKRFPGRTRACTFFCGSNFINSENDMLLSYGVNDSYHGFAQIPTSVLLNENLFKSIPYVQPPELPFVSPESKKTDLTISAQAKSATKSLVHGAKSVIKTNVLRMDRAPEEIYKERLNTCENCPGNHAVFKNGTLYSCGKMLDSVTGKAPTCGCVLSKKARDIKEECPMGYWKT